MMAQCQFATIQPNRKKKQWNGREYTEYNYGIYTADSDKDIRYLPTSQTSHRDIQRKFRDHLKEGKNPTEFLWEVRRSLSDYADYQIYTFTPLYLDGWVVERDRPPLNGKIQEWEI
tara:strand:- start:129 stop:476 length:348 start_codon:yes stop_codon:yes gene_type:complete